VLRQTGWTQDRITARSGFGSVDAFGRSLGSTGSRRTHIETVAV